jgi:hypothetical protein
MMLTLKRFGELADAYGGDLQRWPAEVRLDAQTLMDDSPEARAMFAEARQLDEALRVASEHRDSALFAAGQQEAAVARLRPLVEMRIGPSTASRFGPGAWRAWKSGFAWIPARLVSPGLATGGAFALAVGLLIGFLSAPPSTPGDVLAMLEPAPIHIFGE